MGAHTQGDGQVEHDGSPEHLHAVVSMRSESRYGWVEAPNGNTYAGNRFDSHGGFGVW